MFQGLESLICRLIFLSAIFMYIIFLIMCSGEFLRKAQYIDLEKVYLTRGNKTK